MSHHFAWLILCAIPIGFGAGAIDAVLNNYVALHYKASHMNFMQCCYGIGVSVSPYLMSLALSKATNWNQGYFMAFWLQAGITLVVLLSLPLWKKVKHRGQAAEEEITQVVVPTKKLLKNKISASPASCASPPAAWKRCAPAGAQHSWWRHEAWRWTWAQS